MWVGKRHQERITMSGKIVRVEKIWKNVQNNNRKQSAFLCPRPASSVGRAFHFWSNAQWLKSVVGRKTPVFEKQEAGKHEKSELTNATQKE